MTQEIKSERLSLIRGAVERCHADLDFDIEPEPRSWPRFSCASQDEPESWDRERFEEVS